ncbi:MAG: tRNA (guanosine(46)-N7)-methyltransferase TrmB [Sandaracinus sp.]
MAEGTPPPIRYELMARRPPEGAIDLGTLVPGTGELELEIGFGRGRFLIERARAAPSSRIVGIEIKSKWSHLVEERRKKLGLENVVALYGDAREVLPRLGPDGSLARAFVHFPDPWWKKRHARRRVVDDVLMTQLGRLMRPGGALFVQTDVEERAIAMAENIVQSGLFRVEPGFAHANPYGARSNREARADEDGLPVFRIHATRI